MLVVNKNNREKEDKEYKISLKRRSAAAILCNLKIWIVSCVVLLRNYNSQVVFSKSMLFL
jgi:hypothetical protein